MVGLKVADDGSALASVIPLQKLSSRESVARARKEITSIAEMLEALPRKSRVKEAMEASLRQLRIQGVPELLSLSLPLSLSFLLVPPCLVLMFLLCSL